MAKRKRNGFDSEEDVVTMSTLRELLDNQKREFTSLMEVQQKNFNSFMETFMVTTNKRLDDIVREVQDAKGSLQYSQREIDQDQRITEIESKIVELRSDVDCSMLTLFFDGLSRKRTVVKIHKDATVDKLFWKVIEKTKMTEAFQLLYEPQQLEYGSGKYLSDYDMEDKSTIFVLVRFSGGRGASPN
ncbi:hypothetical protein Bbelb_092100 [Branchiostoma belcheri]|nr:hypothetical protein Bbelb_092100 [Branchiostoma belcheri]